MPTPEIEYRTICLTQEQFTIVDSCDFAWLNQWKWYASWDKTIEGYYAHRQVRRSGKKITIPMHRLILGLECGDKMQGDHENLDTLDNRRFNLRIATPAQNKQNNPKTAQNTSGFKGATFCKATGLWQSEIRFDNKRIYLGRYPTAELAHAVYSEAAAKHHGEFARLE